ncbi:hypothetical protein K501DRAFT_287653 [Backusella circina FSU 941]|nr:hypothetical protein K501DRAFT_287653 [Backusella circina FSU 941]
MSQVENITYKLKNRKSFLWNSKKATDSTQTPCLKKKKSTLSTLLSTPGGALKKRSSGFFTTVLGKINSRLSKNTTKQQDENNIDLKIQPRPRGTNNLKCGTDISLTSKSDSKSINSGYNPIISSLNTTNTEEMNEWSSKLLDALDATQNKVNSETDTKEPNHTFINRDRGMKLQTISNNDESNLHQPQNKNNTRKRFVSSTSSKRKSDYQLSWRQNFNNISDLTLDEGLHQRSSIQQDCFSILSEYNHPSVTEATPRSTSEFNHELLPKKDFEDSKVQKFDNKPLLSMQLNNQNVANMTVQEKLEIAAARRNLIKYNRQREQMDTAFLETVAMLSNGQYIETPSTSRQQQNDMKVRDWIVNCQQKDSDISVNNLDSITSQNLMTW